MTIGFSSNKVTVTLGESFQETPKEQASCNRKTTGMNELAIDKMSA